MGIERNSARALIGAYRDGISFESVITFGRQFLTTPLWWLNRQFDEAGVSPFAPNPLPERDPGWRFAEPFLAMLGAKTVVSIDYSDYEGATYIHDFNFPLPESFDDTYHVVYDSGTLEHVFNFPVAIENLMRLVVPGGRLILHLPINNWCGHGFYQFSPEIFYKVLCADNGFEVERMIAVEMFFDGRWYEVSDPSKLRSRVELMNGHRTHIFVQAKRLRESPIFETYPQQADYEVMWTAEDDKTAAAMYVPQSESRVLPRIRKFLQHASPGLLRWMRLRQLEKERKNFSLESQPEKYRRVEF